MPQPQPPTIDIAPLFDADADARRRVADLLAVPCERWGLFHVTGHGIEPHALRRFDAATRTLFAQPEAALARCTRSRDNAWGYYDRELTKNRPDWKRVFDFGREVDDDEDRPRHSDGHNRWPDLPDDARDVLLAHHAACERISRALTRALCLSLGLDETALDRYFERDSSFTRLNYYPPCPNAAPGTAPLLPEAGRLAVHHHTDAGALTVLYQDDAGGLQLWDGERCLDIEPVPGALTINLGDMLRVWSNDRYRSPVHRVVAHADRDRVSAPFFFNPDYDTVCEPLATGSEADDRAPRFRPVSWAHFRDQRSAGDFADYGAEIQIDDFLVSGQAPSARRPSTPA